jgi:phosphatidylglycerol:prolipoprotein diacylglycerol transferase
MVLGWLWYLKSKGVCQRDHLMTGGVVIALVALFLALIHWMGHFTVNSYGAMLMLGFIGGIYTGTRLGIRRHIPGERIMDLGLLVLVAAIIGARVMYIMLTPNAGPILDVKEIMTHGVGGLSFYGGMIGGVLVSIFYVRATKINFWRLGDALAPGIALGYAITRIGCFLNGCCYGKPSTLPWAMNFPFSPDGPTGLVHPTQLYASLMGFAMFGILLYFSRGDSLKRAGRLFMLFLMMEGVERITMEIFRAPDPHYNPVITPAMYFCAVLIICGLIGWHLLPKQAAIPEDMALETKLPEVNNQQSKRKQRNR